MDLGTATLIVGVLAIVVSSILAFPAFLNQLLDLRKRWKTEFPPKTLEQLLSQIPRKYQNPRALLLGFRLATFRALIGVFDIALISYVDYGILTGHPLPDFWLTGVDIWLVAMAMLAAVWWRRMRSIVLFIKAAEVAESQGRSLPKPPW